MLPNRLKTSAKVPRKINIPIVPKTMAIKVFRPSQLAAWSLAMQKKSSFWPPKGEMSNVLNTGVPTKVFRFVLNTDINMLF